MRFITLVKLLVAACVAFAIALVAVVKTIDVHQYRLLVIDLLHAATGRSVVIRGDFQLSLSLNPRIVATEVAIANPQGEHRADLLTMARIEAEIGLFALLRREIEVSRLILVEPDLALEIDERGRGNWLRAAPTPPASLRIETVTVQGGRLTLRDRSTRNASVLSLDQITISAADTSSPIAFSARGQFGALPLDLSGTLGSFAVLEGQNQPFPVAVQISAGSNHALIEGRLAYPASLSGMDLTVALQGNEIAEAAHLLGRNLPALGPFRASLAVSGSWDKPDIHDLEGVVGKVELLRMAVSGTIAQPWNGRGVALYLSAETRSPARLGRLFDVELPLSAALSATGRLMDTADGWRLSDLNAVLGHSDLNGTVAWITAARPSLNAVLTSKIVDLNDWGLKPVQSLPKTKSEPWVRDDALLPLTGENRLDMSISWHAAVLLNRGITLCPDPTEATLRLRGGVLFFRPFTITDSTLTLP